MPLPKDEVFALRLVQAPGQPMSLKTSHSNGKGGFDYDLRGLYIAMLRDALALVEAAPVVGGIITQTDEALTLGLSKTGGIVPIRA